MTVRDQATWDHRRARYLSLRVSTLVDLHDPQHPAVRAYLGRYWAASGMVPQVGHRLWDDSAFTTGFSREAGVFGYGNRAARK